MTKYSVRYININQEVEHSREKTIKSALRSADILANSFQQVWVEEYQPVGAISVSRRADVDVSFVIHHTCAKGKDS